MASKCQMTLKFSFWGSITWLFISSLLLCFFSDDADTSATELGNWLVALKDIKFDMSSITKLVEFVKRYWK